MNFNLTKRQAGGYQDAGVSFPGLLILAAFSLIPLLLAAAPPGWWQARGVLDSSQQSDDFAAVNTGQLKNMAKKAMLELDAKIPGGAGSAIHAVVDAWPGQTVGRDDFAAVNTGQVKAVGKLFYDRLNQAGYTQPYPWNPSSPTNDDFAAVNVGQLKSVFAFCVDCLPEEDSDNDGLADWWENQHFEGLGVTNGTGDEDHDGFSNTWELVFLTNPRAYDTDADGIGDAHEVVTFASFGISPINAYSKDVVKNDSEWLGTQDSDSDGLTDLWEVAENLDPLSNSDAGMDQDGDGLTAAQEFLVQSDPSNPDSDHDGIQDGMDGGSGMHANDPFNGQYDWQSELTESSSLTYHTATYRQIFIAEGEDQSYNTMFEISVEINGEGVLYVTPDTGNYPLVLPIGEQQIEDNETHYLETYTSNLNGPGQPPMMATIGVEIFSFLLQVRKHALTGKPVWKPGPRFNPDHSPPHPVENEPSLPLLPVDLDIVHPAAGELDEVKQHDATKGGIIAVRRDDQTPVTKLVLRPSGGLPSGSKFKLQFGQADRYKIWKDEEHTQAVTSGQTEFDPTIETTLYLEGLKRSFSRGAEEIKLQVVINGSSIDAETVKLTVTEAEFDVFAHAFIPYQWVAVPLPYYSTIVAHGDDRDYDPTLKGTSRMINTVTIIPFEELSSSPIKQIKLPDGTTLPAKSATCGETKHFHRYTSLANPGCVYVHEGEPACPNNRLSAMALADEVEGTPYMTERGTASTDDMDTTAISVANHIAVVRIDSSAGEPIVFPAEPIDYSFTVTIDSTDPLNPKFRLSGEQDGFPAYEVYVRTKKQTNPNQGSEDVTPMYQWKPTIGFGVEELLPVWGDVTIEPATEGSITLP